MQHGVAQPDRPCYIPVAVDSVLAAKGREMKWYRRIGVFLTGSPADDVALGYAGEFAKLAESEKVVCVYVHGGGPEAAGDESIDIAQLREKVIGALPDQVSRNAAIEVHEGQGVAEILRSARDLELDLIVKGRRLPAHQASVGSAFTKLARKSPCSVLIVPNYSRPHFSRLLVAIDCSKHSMLALESAAGIVRASGESPQIIAQAVGYAGYGYHKLGLSLEQAVTRQTKALQEELDEFLADFDQSGLQFETVCTCSEDAASAVHELSAARKMDIIVVGSRGLSTTAAAILGSTAEQILMHASAPVLIVKEKGETTGLLNALLDA